MSARRRGLTLLELVIVVAILAAIAAAAISVTDEVDNQSRFDVTKSRAQQIHDAIVGPGGSLNGSPVVQGFVADMGRLPASLAELTGTDVAMTAVAGLTPSCVPLVYTSAAFDPTNVADYYQMPTFATNVTLTQPNDPNKTAVISSGSFTGSSALTWASTPGAGWRGPYLRADSDGTFRDGFGNLSPASVPASPGSLSATATDPATPLSPDAVDFGWRVLQPGNNPAFTPNDVTSPTGTLLASALTSLAPPFTLDNFGNQAIDTFQFASYSATNALVPPGGTPAPLWQNVVFASSIAPDDYLVRISGWSGSVTLYSTDSTQWPLSSYYHLGLFYPKVALPSANATLALTWECVVSQPLQLTASNFGASSSFTYSFTFAGSTNDVRVPIGSGVVVVFQEAANEGSAVVPTAQQFPFGDPVAQTYKTTFVPTGGPGYAATVPIQGIFVGNPNIQTPIAVTLAPRAALPQTLLWNARPQ